MPVDMEIMEGGHIIRYTYAETWTIAEYASMEEQDRSYRESVNHKVHSLSIAKMKMGPAGALRTRNSPALTHRTAGNIAVVGAGKIAQVFAEAVFRMTHFQRVRFFDTEEQALAWLREIIRTEQTIS
jgi:hypothetical protein